MRTRTAAAITATLLLALAGCSTTSADPKPATVTVTASPRLSKTEQTQHCVDAVADVATGSEGTSTDGVPFEPTPAPCLELTESEYLDAYMDGILQHNRINIEEAQREIEEASRAAEADQP